MIEVRRSGLLVLAPLLVLGSAAAHALAYLWAEPDGRQRAALLAGTGHAYLSWLPAVLGGAALALTIGLGLRVAGAARGVGARRAHPLLVAVPVTAFLVQETVERAAAGTFTPAQLVTRPVQLGVLLQVACGLLALLATRLLLDGAECAGRWIARRRDSVRRVPVTRLLPAAVHVLPPQRLGSNAFGRAPPTAVN
ncbi:MAG TPA: hypothetical protein VH416_08695 [Gaiellaceae bacterium]